MNSKKIIMLLMGVGSILGGYIPTLLGADSFSMVSLIGSIIGGVVGIWIGVKIT